MYHFVDSQEDNSGQIIHFIVIVAVLCKSTFMVRIFLFGYFIDDNSMFSTKDLWVAL